MFYFKFHIGDYRRETSHLTLLEHGVYMSLMSTYYASEQPLPKDERQLLRLAGARTEEEKQAVKEKKAAEKERKRKQKATEERLDAKTN